MVGRFIAAAFGVLLLASGCSSQPADSVNGEDVAVLFSMSIHSASSSRLPESRNKLVEALLQAPASSSLQIQRQGGEIHVRYHAKDDPLGLLTNYEVALKNYGRYGAVAVVSNGDRMASIRRSLGRIDEELQGAPSDTDVSGWDSRSLLHIVVVSNGLGRQYCFLDPTPTTTLTAVAMELAKILELSFPQVDAP